MKRILVSLLIATCFINVSFSKNVQQDCNKLTLESTNVRWAFVRGETVVINFHISNRSGKDIHTSKLEFKISDFIKKTEPLPELKSDTVIECQFKLDTLLLKSGQYSLNCSLISDGNVLCSRAFPFWIARKWNSDRMQIWMWPHNKFVTNVQDFNEKSINILTWYADKGFNVLGPALESWATNISSGMNEARFKLYDYMLYNGLEVCFTAENGYFIDIDVNDPSAKVKMRSEKLGRKEFSNPFHPLVSKKQDELNEQLMQKIWDFPGITMCFTAGEIEDRLPGNLPLAQNLRPIPYTVEHKFISPGVIPDNDAGYIKALYRFEWGDGLSTATERISQTVHRYRPDILVFSDPLRNTTVYNRFKGENLVSSWTYTNPDPKQMLFIETLIANAKGSQMGVLPTVTLWNYSGSVAPKDKGLIVMGPDRLVETSWINLSRSPNALGYYIGSPFDSINPSVDTKNNNKKASYPYQLYPETFEALKHFTNNVVKPYGPMIKNLERSSRKVAVLSSESSKVYSASPRLLGYYSNYQVYSFYILLAMAHIPADIVFDQTITQFGLDGYDVLVIPKCDTLTETVYKKILAFKAKGGLVIADQYLRADIPDTIKFDFDFTPRTKVSANALIEKADVADAIDNEARETNIQTVRGVTAEDDQKMMEMYANQLRKILNGKIDREVDCNNPTVLLNMLEKDGVKYLFVINDKRIYGDRLGEYKAILEKGVSQTVRILLNASCADNLNIYDIIEHNALSFAKDGNNVIFDVNLPAAGGKIIALIKQKPESIEILVPQQISKRASQQKIDILIKDKDGLLVSGAIPLQVKIIDPEGHESEASDFYAALSGRCSINFVAGLNDSAGRWSIEVSNLMTGDKAKKFFDVK